MVYGVKLWPIGQALFASFRDRSQAFRRLGRMWEKTLVKSTIIPAKHSHCSRSSLGWVRLLSLFRRQPSKRAHLALALAMGLAVVSSGAHSWAASGDSAAKASIDQAINVHYLATNFEKAEQVLQDTIASCAGSCSPGVVARAWMYIGIIRGAGNQDLGGARDAFDQAVAVDSSVALDADLATDELRQSFEAAKANPGAAPSDEADFLDAVREEEPEAAASSTSGSATTVGNMRCTPDVTEVENRRPIPVSCETDEEATRATLYFKPNGMFRFSQISMHLDGDSWRGQIPCTATGPTGPLEWYVVAMDTGGLALDQHGSQDDPVTVSVVNSTTQAPPAYPGEQAPDRCLDPSDCPEEMRGTPACPVETDSGEGGAGAGWGLGCEKQNDCQSGLACIRGTCETPSSCEVDSDCVGGGICSDAMCTYSDDGSSSGPAPKNLVGLHAALDFVQMSGEGICKENPDFVCFVQDQPYYIGTDPNSVGGSFGSSLDPATVRVLLSYERIFANRFGLEGRAGVAFNTAPNSGLLVHIGVRAKYWFSGTAKGFRPYVMLGGGYGQVDGKKLVIVQEGAGTSDGWGRANNSCPDPSAPCNLNVNAYKKLGTSFVTAGGGAFWNLGGHGPALEFNVRYMMPASGLVLQPNLGYLVGF